MKKLEIDWDRIRGIVCVAAMLAIPMFAVATCVRDCIRGSDEKVWICTGPQSKRYHNDIECKGLDSCSGDTRFVTLSQAKDMGRTPCPYCHDGVEPDW